MPRIPYSLLLQSRKISPLLPLLLRICRTLPSAQSELRWLREHVRELYKFDKPHSARSVSHLLNLCEQRSRGVPLQHLLGSQPFGDLDILCRRGVLIPRPETESYTFRLAEILRRDGPSNGKGLLRVLDLCTGSGCISLLLYSLLSKHYSDIQIFGLDISDLALKLARDNLKHNMTIGKVDIHAEQQVTFEKIDLLQTKLHGGLLDRNSLPWDVVISNPPYISQRGFDSSVERSVRNWEPKLALVPPIIKKLNLSIENPEDVFYNRILDLAAVGNARVVLMEVGDMGQAVRIASIALAMEQWSSIEIWRDWPDQESENIEQILVAKTTVPIKGSGLGRSVVCRK